MSSSAIDIMRVNEDEDILEQKVGFAMLLLIVKSIMM